MPHGARNARKNAVATVLFFAFMTSQSTVVKALELWNRKTINTASTRKVSR